LFSQSSPTGDNLSATASPAALLPSQDHSQQVDWEAKAHEKDEQIALLEKSLAGGALASVSTAGSIKSVNRKGLLGRFNRSSNNLKASGENVDWEAKAREKDERIASLEKLQADNALSVLDLKTELVKTSFEYKEEETKRELEMKRLEKENAAYMMVLKVLESELKDKYKTTESVADAENSELTDECIVDDPNKDAMLVSLRHMETIAYPIPVSSSDGCSGGKSSAEEGNDKANEVQNAPGSVDEDDVIRAADIVYSEDWSEL
jgi:hypothetical protein